MNGDTERYLPMLPGGSLVDFTQLFRLAIDKDRVEALQKLQEMWLKEQARQAEIAFNEAMLQAQKVLPPIIRTALNPSTNSKYAKFDEIQKIVTPIAILNGLVITFGSYESKLENHYGVTCTVSKGEFSRTERCDVPCDMFGPKGQPNKTRTHGFGSAISYGQRYLLKLIFNIRVIGEDDDGNLSRPAAPKPPARANEKIKAVFVERMKDIKDRALQYAIDKAWIMPDQGLQDWPLEHVPATRDEYEEIRRRIEAHP